MIILIAEITNIAKHSGATEVSITIQPFHRKGMSLEARDNGIGFDPDDIS